MGNGKCKCGVEFTLENSTATVFKRGRGFCRACDEVYQKNYYKKNSSKIKKNSVDWAKSNPEKRVVISSKYWDSLSEEQRKKQHKKTVACYRQKKFGITQEEFDAKFKKQNGLCEICKQPMLENVRVRIPCQDHNHETGELRDLLCSSCNLLIGHCYENKEILANAIKYLQKHFVSQKHSEPNKSDGVSTIKTLPLASSAYSASSR